MCCFFVFSIQQFAIKYPYLFKRKISNKIKQMFCFFNVNLQQQQSQYYFGFQAQKIEFMIQKNSLIINCLFSFLELKNLHVNFNKCFLKIGILVAKWNLKESSSNLDFNKFLWQKFFIAQVKQFIQVYNMNKQAKNNSKIGWTEEEQGYLEVLCQRQKIADWKYISTQMNAVFITKTRTPKQCRQRFHNYIRFSCYQQKKQGWTLEEDQKLFHLYTNFGSKWAEISKSMPGRSENNIKNRFYGKLRKFIRVMNDTLKKTDIKNRKPIKEATITKILSREKFSKEIQINYNNAQIGSSCFLDSLKLDILIQVLRSSQPIGSQHLSDLLNRIHQFNLQAKAQNIRENRLGKKSKRKRLPPLRKENPHQIVIQDQQNKIEQVCLKIFEENQTGKEKNVITKVLDESSLSDIQLANDFRAQISLPHNFEEEISFIFCKNKPNVKSFASFQY